MPDEVYPSNLLRVSKKVNSRPDQVRFYNNWAVISSHQKQCNNWLPMTLFLTIMRY